MRILHYFLGFPPYRTGGLTKFSMDLMEGQLKDGNVVMALWPGRLKAFCRTVTIKRKESMEGLESYEIINPLPVSLDEGIRDFDEFMKPCDEAVYRDFLWKTKPEVIHIHTLMGLHREFLAVAAAAGIRTVFTAHDYFGICPRITLYRQGQACDDDHGCLDCLQCNRGALSFKRIQMMQSSPYRVMKNSNMVKGLRKRHRAKFFVEGEPTQMPLAVREGAAVQYRRLRAYYVGMLEKIDLIHFNSTVSEEVFKRYLKPRKSQVLSISHQDIKDNKGLISWKPSKSLRITYLSPAKPFKGFFVLKEALDDLWDEGGFDFELKVYGPLRKASPYMKVRERGFTYSQLRDIMTDTDVLVAPSVWYETFGFTVLEAISYGVPVVVSHRVGAKDIIGEGGIIVEAGDKEGLKQAIKTLTPYRLAELRNTIISSVSIKPFKTFVHEMYQLYWRS